MNRRTILAAGPSLVVASLFVVACSSTAATNAPGGAGQSSGPGASLALPSIAIPSVSLPAVSLPAVSLPAVSLPAVSLPAVSLPAGSFAIPSFPSEDKDLEARLPNQVNGVTLTKSSFKGQTFLQSGASSNNELIALLASIGKSANDLSAAFAVDATGTADVQIGAIRIAGTESNTLLNAFVTSTKNETPGVQVTQGNVGGKSVNQIVDPTDTESGTTYAYANGDTLFFVTTKDQAIATSALQAMP